MFSFNKNSISLKRHMLRRYRDADGDGDGVHVDSSSSSRRSISCRAVGLRRMQLGKGSSYGSLRARPLPLASGRCARNVFQFIMTTLADWRVGISAVYRLVCVRVCVRCCLLHSQWRIRSDGVVDSAATSTLSLPLLPVLAAVCCAASAIAAADTRCAWQAAQQRSRSASMIA